MDYEDIAREYLDKHEAFYSHSGLPAHVTDPDNWICVMESADLYGATLLDKSNFEVLSDDLFKRFPDDTAWGAEGCLAVRAFRDGKLTEACREGLEAAIFVEEQYPVLDDEDYSRRQYEAGLENISYVGSVAYEAPDDWPAQVFSWLWDNDQEALDYRDEEDGYAPSEDAVNRAIIYLGFFDKEDVYRTIVELGTPCLRSGVPASWPQDTFTWLLQHYEGDALSLVKSGDIDEDVLLTAMSDRGILDEPKCAAYLVGRRLVSES